LALFLFLSPKDEKAIKKLTKNDKVLGRLCNPLEARDAKFGDLAGIYGYDIYHQGINYEIAYFIDYDEVGILVVVLAGTRKNFYNHLKGDMKANKNKPPKQRK
jgi:mRNA interferase RelE/StbE